MQDALSNRTERSDPPRAGVRAIARAAAVLRALEAAPEGATLGEIAAAVGLAKSTVHRLVVALREEELVAVTGDDRIRLGPALARLAAASRHGLADELRPTLLRLRRELDETVDLSILEGPAVRFIEQLPATRRLHAVSAVGASFPAHCTANGKALLAALPDHELEALLPTRLARLTPATETSRARLLAELAEVREDGVAVDREEHTEGICALGAAVCDGAGAVAAISVPVPSQRFAASRERCARRLREAAGEATRVLGGAPPVR